MKIIRSLKDAQRFLAIETSSPRLSLALGTSSGPVRSYQGPLQWRHAESLFSGLESLLKRQRWSVQSLTGVVVSTGPGSFTGIRIGLAAARALGQSLKIPVIGVSSLQTLAYRFLQPDRYVCSAMNALRGEVFTALYTLNAQGKIKIIWKECRWPLSLWLRKLKMLRKKSLWLAGDAVRMYQTDIRAMAGHTWQCVPDAQAFPQARELIQLAGGKWGKSHALSYKQVVPTYLRSAAAVERRNTLVTL